MLIHRILIISLLVFLFTKCVTKKSACYDVQNGTFYYNGKLTGHRYKIIRQDSLQKEIDQNNGDTSTFSVKWFDECNYELRLIKGMKTMPVEIRKLAISKSLFLRILEINTDYFLIKVNSEFLPSQGVIDTVWRKEKVLLH